jgi:hypothetical protein
VRVVRNVGSGVRVGAATAKIAAARLIFFDSYIADRE